MTKYVLRLIILLFVIIAIQTNTLSAQSVEVESSITELMDLYVQKNREKNYISGWRIQLLATTDRRAMESTRSKFARTFPQIRSFWNHIEPYYYLRAGAFANKLEALPELKKVKRKFPSAYIVIDKIKYSELTSK